MRTVERRSRIRRVHGRITHSGQIGRTRTSGSAGGGAAGSVELLPVICLHMRGPKPIRAPRLQTASPFTAVDSAARPTMIVPREGAVSAGSVCPWGGGGSSLNPLISKVPVNSGASGGQIKAGTARGSVSREFPEASPLCRASPFPRCISVCDER